MDGNGRLTGCRILVVEDEAVTAVMIEQTLKEAGCDVIGPVATVSGALAMIKAEAIDCAILDLELADGKAGPVAEALVKRGIRFVITTGYEPSGIKVPNGSVPTIGKAFDLNELLGTVDDILDRPARRHPDVPPDLECDQAAAGKASVTRSAFPKGELCDVNDT